MNDDTLEPTVERLRQTFEAVAKQVTDAPPTFQPSPVVAAPTDDVSAEMAVLEVRRTQPDSAARRRWVVAVAAVVAAVLLAAVTVLATRTGDDHIRTKPASSGTAPTATTPPNVVTPPNTLQGDGSTQSPLVPKGVASTPPTSDLVAALTLYHRGAYRLYADGRFLSYVGGRDGGWFVEQRLTPEGVERVRLQVLASALFERAQPAGDVLPCSSGFQACVRDGDRVLVADVPPASTPNPLPVGDSPPEAVALFDYLGTLDSSLPVTDWADRETDRHVPARIATCMRTFLTGGTDQAQELPLDLSGIAPRVPAPAANLLAGREPSADLATRLTVALPPNSFTLGGCFELTLDEARTLADTLLSPTGGGTHEYWGITIRLAPRSDPAPPDTMRPDVASIHFEDLLPDGTPRRYFGG